MTERKKNAISPRIRTEKEDDALLVRIDAYRDPNKQRLLSAWLLLWSICGLVVLYFLFLGVMPREEKLVLFVFLVFWGYFQHMGLKAFFWRRSGVERIRIDNEGVTLRQEAPLFKRGAFFRPDELRELRPVETREESFQKQFENAYFVIGAFALEFIGSGKRAPFGEKLGAQEGKKLTSLLKKALFVEKS